MTLRQIFSGMTALWVFGLAVGSAQAQVRASGSTSAYLGFQFQCTQCAITITDSLRSFEFSSPPEVFSLTRGGPAEKAGMKVGDAITHVNGASITTAEGSRRFANLQPNQQVRVTLRRGSDVVNLTMTPVALPAADATALRQLDGMTGLVGNWGSLFGDSIRVWTRQDWNGWSTDSVRKFFSNWRPAIGGDSAVWRAFTGFADRWTTADSGQWRAFAQALGWRDSVNSQLWQDYTARGNAFARDSTMRQAFSGFFDSFARQQYSGNFAGLSVTVTGEKPVTVSVVEPDCVLAIEVEGTRVLVRAPKCG